MSYYLISTATNHAILADAAPLDDSAPLQLNDATALVKALEKRYADIIEAGEKSAALAKKKAQAEGYKEGRLAGFKKGKAEVGETIARCEKKLHDAIGAARDDMSGLAIEIVRKIASGVGSDVMVAALAETAARNLIPDEPITVRVHPTALEAATQRLAPLQLNAQVEADKAMAKTGCVIETRFGAIDAGLETQLELLTDAFASIND